ncbi:ceramide kinase-like protein isoform X2 [Mizuhopecten yessoensis]|uniref:Ceramide kinase n=1 Tax=Mizuhopecten yessoensis TaxID=6573 RepID=A0A210QJD4_MIZYE|nr:ceramide kinase-like protein isoform X2 [Mizuhopecten yessoensis]OWF48850.1 Ceramide kinase [Mizuhopecten yessoensis]
MFPNSLERNMDKVTYRMNLSGRQNQKSVLVDVTLTETVLMWARVSQTKNSEVTSICTDDLLAVQPLQTGSDVVDLITYRMFYVEHFPQRVMRMNSVVLSMGHSEAVSFLTKINLIINGSSKPRRLLVFINPISGRKKGTTVYRKQLSPLFRICGIDVDVVVTKRRRHISSVLEKYDLSSIDGIVTVGGDGLYSECMDALLRKQHQNSEIELDTATPTMSDIPVGIIPAGTGNVLVEFLHGNKDIETAVLHIIKGKTSRSNVAGLYENRKLTVFAGLVLGFGLCGEMVRDCEKMRWLGPTRHSAPLKAFFQRRTIDLEVTSRQGATTSVIEDTIGPNSRLSGPMYSLDMWVPTLVNGPRKMKPTFWDSSLSLHAVHKCSFVDHLRHLLKVNSRQTGCFDYDFVKTIQGSGFKVCLQRSHGSTRKHYINHDGEHTLLTSQSFDVRLHEGAIKLFGTMN